MQKLRKLRMIDSAGKDHDVVEVPAGKNLPEVVIWGINDRQKVFLHDRDEVYREVSWIVWMGPKGGAPLSVETTGRPMTPSPPPVGRRGI